MNNFKYEVADHVAIITWDVPEKSHNIMSWKGFEELSELVDQALNDDVVRGIVITSRKETFSLGMDLKILQELGNFANDPNKIYQSILSIHEKFRRIERAGGDHKQGIPGKPIATAINGTCLGIGYEIALSTHRIICADTPQSSIGLPEVKIGLFPGAGGTTRLARRLGLMASGPFILQGKTPKPKDALMANLVDEVVPLEHLINRAKEWVLNAKPEDLIKPWDASRETIPGGKPYDKQGFLTFVGASAMSAGQSQNIYPAVKSALASIYEGFMVPFDQAIKVEAKWFSKLLMDPSSSAMINSVFVNRKVLENGARRPSGVDRGRFREIGIVGAGMMGSGISLVAAQNGLKVNLMDIDINRANDGKDTIKNLLTKEKSRNRIDNEQFNRTLDNIYLTDSYNDLKSCQLVIEAVFEDPEVKSSVLKQLSSCIPSDCLVASNTSTIPITSLANHLINPERFIGMHFFSPVHKMSLLEIIRGKNTSSQTTAWAFDFSRLIRKTPIIVNDQRFFYANRCIIPYINEGVSMVGEGYKPALIENASRQLGMPVGPLQLIDETSLDLAVQIANASQSALGSNYEASDSDRVIYKLADLGRLGRKAGAGFYEYDSHGKRKGLWAGLMELYPPISQQPEITIVKNRLLLTQVIEAIKSYEEGVLGDIREGDVAAIYGWGFAPWSGGPFRWVDNTGIRQVIDMCEFYTTHFGKRFQAPELLSDLLASGQTFYEFNQDVS